MLIEVCAGEDTMTGDGGEYLRAEDLRELGDDSLSGQYLDGMSYLSHNLDRYTHTHTHNHIHTITYTHIDSETLPLRPADMQICVYVYYMVYSYIFLYLDSETHLYVFYVCC